MDRRWLTAGMVVLAAALPACGGSSGGPEARLASSPAASGSAAVPLALATGQTAGGRNADPDVTARKTVVDRYLLFLRTLEQVSAAHDINSPALRDVATGNQLIQVIENLVKDRARGTTYRGHIDARPTVAYLAPNRKAALLQDCNDSSHFLPYRNGRLVAPGEARRDGVKVTMLLADGRWRVAGTEFTVGRCS